MVHRFWLLAAIVFGLGVSLGGQTLRCGSDARRAELYAENPALLLKRQEREARLQARLRQGGFEGRGTLTIPVVVHILWHEPEENLPDERIHSQIEALNRDFQALNEEIPLVPAEFAPFIAEVGIEFCLATHDPEGNPTDGITRTFTPNPAIGGSADIHYTERGGHDAWDTERYLNIWVAKFQGVSGVGSFPGEDPPAEQGVEVDYRYFGTIDALPPLDRGRTTTHEVGHFLNLEHPWGPNFDSGCNEDDFVDDTPLSSRTYNGECPSHPQVSCGSNDMFMNFMYYTDDACMALFTLGQKARMLAALELFRPALLEAAGCLPVATHEPAPLQAPSLFPNPSSGSVVLELPPEWQGATLRLFDIRGRALPFTQCGSPARPTLQLEGLPPGAYWLFVEKNGARSVRRLILAPH
ncbi:MAG: zinc metalloprotease [Bacteroidetes bacterium]|nr:MAG: zinc metalloprotease [Bacteroidota bacterium]